MTTVTRPGRLRGWSVRRASIVLVLAFCASAFAADADKNVVLPEKQQTAPKRSLKVCYVKSSVSGIPQRCDRLAGGFPTTASPLVVIGQTR